MRVRNIWFALLPFFGAVFMLGCAVISLVDYIQGRRVGYAVAAIATGTFLLLAAILFRVSLQLGDRQKKVHERKKTE